MGTQTRTQVAIIGGGPAGLLLSHILHLSGVESIVLERQTKAYVLSRIRAGVLEFGTTDLLRQMGLGERMDREGHVHAGIHVTWHERDPFTIDTETFTGRPMMAYGQTAITEDLYTAREAAGAQIIEEAVDVALHDVTSDAPYVTYEKDGQSHRIDCDFIAGCDGFHRYRQDHVREDLPVWLAGHHVRDAAAAGDHVRLPPQRLRARLAAQPNAQPLLCPVPQFRHGGRLVR